MPSSFSVDTVETASLLLNGAIPAEKTIVSDDKIVAKFDREGLIEYLEGFKGSVDFFIRGVIPNEVIFEGSDEVRVISRKP